MVNLYLVFAYGLAWGIFVVYAWVLSGRETQIGAGSGRPEEGN